MTVTVHELLKGIEAPVGEPKVSVVAPAVGAQVGVPPQVVAAAGVAATCKPVGSVSVNVTPVNALEAFGLDNVKVKVETPLIAMGFGAKAFVIVGGLSAGQPLKITLSR